MNRRRPKQIVIRASEEEFKKIKLKVSKSKLSQNEYLLKCCLNKKINVIEGLKDLTIELKDIGKNINDLKKQDSFKENNREELLKIEGELKNIWQLLRQLIQKTQ